MQLATPSCMHSPDAQTRLHLSPELAHSHSTAQGVRISFGVGHAASQAVAFRKARTMGAPQSRSHSPELPEDGATGAQKGCGWEGGLPAQVRARKKRMQESRESAARLRRGARRQSCCSVAASGRATPGAQIAHHSASATPCAVHEQKHQEEDTAALMQQQGTPSGLTPNTPVLCCT